MIGLLTSCWYLEFWIDIFFCCRYLAISTFPARRQKVIDKVKRKADTLAYELEEAMKKDLTEAIENLDTFVKVLSKPYQDEAQNRLNRLVEIQEELSNVEKKLRTLQIDIQNLHVSWLWTIQLRYWNKGNPSLLTIVYFNVYLSITILEYIIGNAIMRVENCQIGLRFSHLFCCFSNGLNIFLIFENLSLQFFCVFTVFRKIFKWLYFWVLFSVAIEKADVADKFS